MFTVYLAHKKIMCQFLPYKSLYTSNSEILCCGEKRKTMEKQEDTFSTLGKAVMTAVGLGLAGYVIHEVAKEYDDTVNEYNELVEFINKHDFYEKSEDTEIKPELEKVETLSREDGSDVDVWQDPVSGFKVYRPKNR